MEKKSIDPFVVSRIQVAPKISYMLNNLTASDNYVAYYSTSTTPETLAISQWEVLGNKKCGVKNTKCLRVDVEPVTDMKYVYVFDRWVLVVTFLSIFRIYSENGHNLLFEFKKCLGGDNPNYKDTSELNSQYKAITTIKTVDGQEAICIGTSNQEVYFVEQHEGKYNGYVGIVFTQKKTSISQLAACQEDNQLITADTEGNLNFFLTTGLKAIDYVKNIDSQTHNSPIISMKVMERKKKNPDLNNLLVAGDFIGKIQIYCLKEYYQVGCVNSHIRMLTCLDVNNEKGEIVTGSEDTYLNFWKIDDNTDILLKVSYRLSDQVILGVKFLDQAGQNVFVATLDSLDFTVLQAQR